MFIFNFAPLWWLSAVDSVGYADISRETTHTILEIYHTVAAFPLQEFHRAGISGVILLFTGTKA